MFLISERYIICINDEINLEVINNKKNTWSIFDNHRILESLKFLTFYNTRSCVSHLSSCLVNKVLPYVCKQSTAL